MQLTRQQIEQSPLLAHAREIANRLRTAGHEAYFAGGCVRDLLLNRPPKDVDIATSASPDAVEALFERSIAIGKHFGVICVVAPPYTFDVATFRADAPYADGRHPQSVSFCSAREDARRRDFTINGLFLDPEALEVIDYVTGLPDLERGRVRAIGDPEARFREDHLRMLRAVRFAAVLEFTIDPATADAIRRQAASIHRVSAERIGQELTRTLLEAPRPGRALRQALDLGLLDAVLPEVAAMHGTEQPPLYHPEGDVFTHVCLMLDGLPAERSEALTYAVLLHDVGKPPTATVEQRLDGSEILRFKQHATVGADMTRRILRRLKRPRRVIDEVETMVRRHMTFHDAPRMREARLRRFMAAPSFRDELILHRLDAGHSAGDLSVHAFLAAKAKALAAEPIVPAPWLRGQDLLALGIAPGPALGQLLRDAHDRQIEGDARDAAQLLAWVRAEANARELLPQSPAHDPMEPTT